MRKCDSLEPVNPRGGLKQVVETTPACCGCLVGAPCISRRGGVEAGGWRLEAGLYQQFAPQSLLEPTHETSTGSAGDFLSANNIKKKRKEKKEN